MIAWSERNWLVTGASDGFGRAIVEQVLHRGGRVVATARDSSSLAALAHHGPDRLLALSLDVTRAADIEHAVARAADTGGIDVLVNNAGYGFLGGVEECGDSEVRRQFDVNFFGAAAMMRAFLPAMRARKSGTIVNFSSVAGATAGPGGGYYSASKFALEGLSEALAIEGKPLGIRVLVVEPGLFRTSFFGRSMARPAHPIAEYALAQSVQAYAASTDGKQPGDPMRAAAIIVDTVDQPELPLRLLLGKEANSIVEAALRERLAEAVSQREIALQACFPEA